MKHSAAGEGALVMTLPRRFGTVFTGLVVCALGVEACKLDSREVGLGVDAGGAGGETSIGELEPDPNRAGSGGDLDRDASPGTQQGAPDGSAGGSTSGEACAAEGSCGCSAGADACAPLPLCNADEEDCTPACGGCLIGGECFGETAPNPDNPCEVCDPARSAEAWSNADGAACDDGEFCTVDDACEGGACAGSERECDDGVACNGVSTCDEAAEACAPGENQCGQNSLCDAASGNCVSTCSGCIIAGTCVPSGSEEPGNPCRICDPARSASAYVAAAGRVCGAGPGVCSGQDTCNANGQCQPNHSPAGTACGNDASSTCDQADTCDGNGACSPRLATNGTTCNDGRFCTVGDSCQGGVCGPTGIRNCGAGLACDEVAGQCECLGCAIGMDCLVAGTQNSTNPCQICDPQRSRTAFSANVGATCGSGPSVCSAQDTCNANGQCQANDSPAGTSCGSGPGTCSAQDTCNGSAACLANDIGGNAVCTTDDAREGRCAQVGSCTELCLLGASLLNQCLLR